MRKAKRIVYLDLDGVLHHEDVRKHVKKGIYMLTPGHTLFEWEYILIRLLAPHPDVGIVLSTSWVYWRSFRYVVGRLSPELQKRVIGATFHNRHMNKHEFKLIPRGQQVAADVFRRAPQSRFALDDDDLWWPQWCINNLICTDGEVGISDPFIQRAIETMLEKF